VYTVSAQIERTQRRQEGSERCMLMVIMNWKLTSYEYFEHAKLMHYI